MFYLLFYSSGLYLTFFYCYIILEGLKKKKILQAERRKKKEREIHNCEMGKIMAEECRRESRLAFPLQAFFYSCLCVFCDQKCDSQAATGHVGDR